MWLIKALRNAAKYAKLFAGLGSILGSIFGTFTEGEKPSDATAKGLAVGSMTGAVFGFGSSLVDDHYAKVYGRT